MYAFNSAAIFFPGHPYIESTTVLSDKQIANRKRRHAEWKEAICALIHNFRLRSENLDSGRSQRIKNLVKGRVPRKKTKYLFFFNNVPWWLGNWHNFW